MTKLDTLLTMPIDKDKRRAAWKQLVRKLFPTLEKTSPHPAGHDWARLHDLLNQWKTEYVDTLVNSGWEKIGWEKPNPEPQAGQAQWEAARAMLLCAQIAWLDPAQHAASLPELLLRLDPEYKENLNALAWTTASVDEPEEKWPRFVRERLRAVEWPLFLSAAWAWDVVASLTGHPRPASPVRIERTNSLLVVSRSQGVTAELMLEALGDEGTGTLYPAPATSLAWRDRDFRLAEQAAVDHIRALGAWQGGSQVDVRWTLLNHEDNQPFPELGGPSAGAAFALGLARLFVEELGQTALADQLRSLNLE